MSMRGIVPVAALAVAALTTGRWSPAEPSEWPLRVVTVSGRAEVSKGSTSGWSAARLRAELEPGAAARTLQGRLTLTTASGQELRLAPLSRIALPEAGATDQPTRVRMEAGSAWVAVAPGSPPREQLEVQTPVVTVTVRGTPGKTILSAAATTSGWVVTETVEPSHVNAFFTELRLPAP